MFKRLSVQTCNVEEYRDPLPLCVVLGDHLSNLHVYARQFHSNKGGGRRRKDRGNSLHNNGVQLVHDRRERERERERQKETEKDHSSCFFVIYIDDLEHTKTC